MKHTIFLFLLFFQTFSLLSQTTSFAITNETILDHNSGLVITGNDLKDKSIIQLYMVDTSLETTIHKTINFPYKIKRNVLQQSGSGYTMYSFGTKTKFSPYTISILDSGLNLLSQKAYEGGYYWESGDSVAIAMLGFKHQVLVSEYHVNKENETHRPKDVKRYEDIKVQDKVLFIGHVEEMMRGFVRSSSATVGVYFELKDSSTNKVSASRTIPINEFDFWYDPESGGKKADGFFKAVAVKQVGDDLKIIGVLGYVDYNGSDGGTTETAGGKRHVPKYLVMFTLDSSLDMRILEKVELSKKDRKILMPRIRVGDGVNHFNTKYCNQLVNGVVVLNIPGEYPKNEIKIKNNTLNVRSIGKHFSVYDFPGKKLGFIVRNDKSYYYFYKEKKIYISVVYE